MRSRSVFLRRLPVLELGDGQSAQSLIVVVDDSERDLEEAYLPLAGLVFFHGDGLAGEGAADMDEVAAPFDLAVGAHLAHRGLGRIVRLGKPLGHCSPRRRVDAGGRPLTQRLVWPLLVVVTREGNEATVLVSPIGRRRPHGLQKRQMEALVPTVLLRLTGVDPFMPDAQ